MPSISIIIPTLNEAASISDVIDRVRDEPDCEIIIVDGGSTDRTLEFCQSADQVISTEPGRGTQLNLGATHATNDVLFFLHADCWPEPGFSMAILKTLENENVIAGAFKQVIDNPLTKYRWLEWGNAQRAKALHWVYGDQGLFVRRSVFEASGGFPEMPLMEDLYFSKSLKKIGKIRLAEHLLHVSPRRWEKTGVFKQTTMNWAFVLMSHMGVPSETLAKWYRTIR